MDPNACLQRIESAIRQRNHNEAQQGCRDLLEWLRKGGFSPSWQRYPEAQGYFQAFYGQYYQVDLCTRCNRDLNAHTTTDFCPGFHAGAKTLTTKSKNS